MQAERLISLLTMSGERSTALHRFEGDAMAAPGVVSRCPRRRRGHALEACPPLPGRRV
jgi:hypothetical protein